MRTRGLAIGWGASAIYLLLYATHYIENKNLVIDWLRTHQVPELAPVFLLLALAVFLHAAIKAAERAESATIAAGRQEKQLQNVIADFEAKHAVLTTRLENVGAKL